MLSFLPSWLKGALALLLYVIYTLVLGVPLFIVALLKFCIPNTTWRNFCRKWVEAIASIWLVCCEFNHSLMGAMAVEVTGMQKFKLHDWYLTIANHQSWVDIFVLTKVFHKKIPMFRFFIKRQLLWLPIIGTAWWALDFPAMRRYSQEKISKNPQLASKDLQASINACRHYLHFPVSIISFVEGTRFTASKQQAQQSPYRYLLKPKAGGLSFVINAMQDHLHTLINVTIAYPEGIKGFWALLTGQVKRVKVHVETLSLTSDLIGNYLADSAYRAHFQRWLNDLWQAKDQRLAKMLHVEE